MRLSLVLIILAGTAVLQADILYLRDGSRYYGELVTQDDKTVVFRIVLADGSSGAIRTFSTAQIERLERTGRRDVPPSPDVPSGDEAEPAEDFEQMLREGFELLDDGDLPAAVRAIQKAVQGAPAPVLQKLEQQCSETRGVPLDELLAGTRVRVAGQTGRGRGFKLDNATRYERAALGRLMARQADTLLARRHQERTVAKWSDDHSDYEELQPDSRRMFADVARAAALINARLRLDPALRDDRGQRARLSKLHDALKSLAAKIMSMPGYLNLSPEDGWIDPAEPPADGETATTHPMDTGDTGGAEHGSASSDAPPRRD